MSARHLMKKTISSLPSYAPISVIPDPGTIVLAGLAALGVAVFARRRDQMLGIVSMRHPAILAALIVAFILARCSSSEAALITQMLGHQAYPDGTKVGTATFATAHAGDPAPFDGTFIGTDGTGPNFAASWTFNYGALSNVTAATLALGILDSDSAAPGNQVASITLNGSIDLTTPLNVAFEANPSASGFVNDYTITLPGSAFLQLETGSATFALTLQGPGLGVLGTTPFNGAALDFSTISITTQPTPEPTSVVLLCTGALALLIYRLRR
jgi:hypothetical protein